MTSSCQNGHLRIEKKNRFKLSKVDSMLNVVENRSLFVEGLAKMFNLTAYEYEMRGNYV